MTNAPAQGQGVDDHRGRSSVTCAGRPHLCGTFGHTAGQYDDRRSLVTVGKSRTAAWAEPADKLLDPRANWSDPHAYDVAATSLAHMFEGNMRKLERPMAAAAE